MTAHNQPAKGSFKIVGLILAVPGLAKVPGLCPDFGMYMAGTNSSLPQLTIIAM